MMCNEKAKKTTASDNAYFGSLLTISSLIGFAFFLASCGGRPHDKIDSDQLKLLEKIDGKIAYNVPELMKVGSPEIFEARLTIDSLARITEDFSGEGNILVEELKLSNRVRVKLISKNDVLIEAIEPEEQGLMPKDFTVWTWKVTAESSGLKHFTIKIGIANFDQYDRSLVSFSPGKSFNLFVKANVIYTVSKFFLDNWQWIFGTILIPLLCYFANRKYSTNEIPEDQKIKLKNGKEILLARDLKRMIAFVIDTNTVILTFFFADIIFLNITETDLEVETILNHVGSALLFSLVYFIFQTSYFGTTIGKRAFGLYIIDNKGRKPKLQWCILRETIRWPSFLLLGFLWGWGNFYNKTAWDLFAKTVVVESYK